MKKIITGALVILMAAAMFTACSGRSSSSGDNKDVTFWYAYKGDEAVAFENAIAKYNESQSNYVVQGLSVTDQQKLIVALASNEAPDAFTLSNQDVINFQTNGLLQGLKPYIDKDRYDMSIYSDKSLEANSVGGEAFALPLSGYTIQMFYNKDILKEIGYDEPPATMEEMYEMAVKATQTDRNGNITRLGYPLFPLASARQELIYGFGGRWWADDGKTLTPENPHNIESLKMNVQYRNLYGIEKVQAFVATANTNRYTAQDMFFAGKQLFRLDGSWLPTMMQNFNSTVNYGIALVPGTKANPQNRGVSRFETSSVSIPITAKNKDGAWDFIKWLSNTEGNKILLQGIGNLPALKSLYTDPEILAKPGFPEFIDALELEKGIQYPQIADFAKYVSLINEHLDYVYAGMQTPEKAMENLAKQSANLK
ncbi:ABC transporter substrate-binding protein [Breznakiella homolactica]|uniref:ABC transporter substrate-binding protein n=1 Tax=Breznakiella homolactica TaxID=2798577 RepID=A0A7T7XLG9_9SPIR|nr:ABC transporter substrate-binding protein [Breznakiella homolactica]QQO08486.1 ABC transporter substrate-binding protein [Breznakiella homolactica]